MRVSASSMALGEGGRNRSSSMLPLVASFGGGPISKKLTPAALAGSETTTVFVIVDLLL